MKLVPMTLKQCNEFIEQHHRHNVAVVGWKFGVGIEDDGLLVGVAVCGRPVARGLDDGTSLEVTRVCTLGTNNANSMLYGAMARAAKALGYTTLYTYTLVEESGASLKASGFVEDAILTGRVTWSTPSRLRDDEGRRPTGDKIRWKRIL